MSRFDRSRPVYRRAGGGATLLLLLSAGASAAWAVPTSFPGPNPATLTGGLIFSVSGNTITVKEFGAPAILAVSGGGTGELLGIDGIWIVDAAGNTIPGIATVAGGGSVSTTQPPFAWDPVLLPPPGYTTANGFPDNGSETWLQLASNADVLAGSGKTVTGRYTVGTFTFAGLSSLSAYDFGFDYLQANANGNGNTGRAFIPAAPPAPVPEPGAVATLLAMGGTTALGVLRGRRPRRPRTAAAA